MDTLFKDEKLKNHTLYIPRHIPRRAYMNRTEKVSKFDFQSDAKFYMCRAQLNYVNVLLHITALVIGLKPISVTSRLLNRDQSCIER